jgi:hypothetical protein
VGRADSRLRRFFAVLVLVGVLSPRGFAQTEKPVYVQYEGFIKNSDGTLTVSFGYFNMNDADVVIQAGERNGFMPRPVDRGQPVTFLKGRHRAACVMVLPPGFDGDLRWRVQNGDTSSLTTAKVLDPNYALEEGSANRAAAGLKLATAPRSTCLTPQ